MAIPTLDIDLLGQDVRATRRSRHEPSSVDWTDGSNYLSALRVLKKTFIDGGEGDTVIDAIAARSKSGVVELLDIGSGDGLFARRAKDKLGEIGLDLHVTAIDPLAAAARDTARLLPGDEVVQGRFEDYSPARQFDVINVRHSLYYLDDPVRQVGRMVALAKPDGLLAFTIWTSECDLFRVYLATLTETADVHPDVFTGETLNDFLRCTPLQDIRFQAFNGTIDLPAWRNSRDVLRDVHLVLSRRFKAGVSSEIFSSFCERFDRLRLSGQRSAAVITGRKPA